MYAPISIHHKIETKEKAPTMKGFKIKLSLVTRISIRNKKNTKKTNALVVKLVDTNQFPQKRKKNFRQKYFYL